MKQKSLLTFLAGALVGAGITWLFNSKQGKEILDKVKSGAGDLKDKVLKDIADLDEQLKQKHNNS